MAKGEGVCQISGRAGISTFASWFALHSAKAVQSGLCGSWIVQELGFVGVAPSPRLPPGQPSGRGRPSYRVMAPAGQSVFRKHGGQGGRVQDAVGPDFKLLWGGSLQALAGFYAQGAEALVEQTCK